MAANAPQETAAPTETHYQCPLCTEFITNSPVPVVRHLYHEADDAHGAAETLEAWPVETDAAITMDSMREPAMDVASDLLGTDYAATATELDIDLPRLLDDELRQDLRMSAELTGDLTTYLAEIDDALSDAYAYIEAHPPTASPPETSGAEGTAAETTVEGGELGLGDADAYEAAGQEIADFVARVHRISPQSQEVFRYLVAHRRYDQDYDINTIDRDTHSGLGYEDIREAFTELDERGLVDHRTLEDGEPVVRYYGAPTDENYR